MLAELLSDISLWTSNEVANMVCIVGQPIRLPNRVPYSAYKVA